MFHGDVQTPRRESKYHVQRHIFDKIHIVGIADETLAQMFDISSQSRQKLKSKQKLKVKSSKSLLIFKTMYPNLLHSCDFVCFNLMKLNEFENTILSPVHTNFSLTTVCRDYL